jgi:hypothetical protein
MTGLFTFWAFPALAANPIGDAVCGLNKDAVGCKTDLLPAGHGSVFQNAMNIVVGVIAAISVLMIIIGGIRYTLSGGDPAGTRSAKDTILYAIVGLIVSMLAFVIVNFIVGAVK